MHAFLALYVKELKANKGLFLFVLLLIAGLNGYGVVRLEGVSVGDISDVNLPVGVIFLGMGAFTLMLSLPFLLAHAFNSEWKSDTHYQMFALPVPQYVVNLAKVAAVASVGVVGGGIVLVSLYFLTQRVLNVMGQTGFISSHEFAFMGGLGLLTYMIFVLGVVTGMEGVKFSVKRYRGLTSVAFFLVAFYLFGRFALMGIDALEFLGSLPVGRSNPGFAPFVYTMLMGVIFLVIGLTVYEKRSEI